MDRNRPNIVLITCDQLRWDYVGAYGCDFIRTPNIDRLAKSGCVCENAYSPNPVCIPARHNLITGLPAKYHGFDDNYFGEEAKPCPYYLPTFAQVLNDSGYETIAVGKMHFQPERRATGFDFFYNMDEIPRTREKDDYAMFLKDSGFGSYQSLHGVRTCLYMQPQISLFPEEYHGSAWVADRSIEYLRQNRGQAPFLLWAGFIQPHPPFDIPEAWRDQYRKKLPDPVASVTPLSALAVENQQLACLDTKEEIMRMREMYAAAVSFADYQIGRILDELEEQGLSENTLVVFTSDHGEMLGDLGTYQKSLPYDAACRIPLIYRYPQKSNIPPRRTDFVDLNDLFPTFLDAAGLEYPAEYRLSGESLFLSNGRKDRRFQYVEHQHGSKRWCSLRNERYKYIYYYGDDEQLFDLWSDPAETTNLMCGTAAENIVSIRDCLKDRLIQYEKEFGLSGCIAGNDFVKQERYQPHPFYETNFPMFVSRLSPEEKEQMTDYEEEILQAVCGETTVKLDRNHTREILKTNRAFDDDRIDRLLNRAREQGN